MSNDDDDTQYDETQVQAMIKEAVLNEREACAKVCEAIERNGAWVTKAEAAAAIRART